MSGFNLTRACPPSSVIPSPKSSFDVSSSNLTFSLLSGVSGRLFAIRLLTTIVAGF